MLGTFLNLSIFDLPTLDFKLAKSTFKAKLEVSSPAAFFKSETLNLPTLDFKLAKSTFKAKLEVSSPAAFFKSETLNSFLTCFL